MVCQVVDYLLNVGGGSVDHVHRDSCFRRPGLEELPDKPETGLQKICHHNSARAIGEGQIDVHAPHGTRADDHRHTSPLQSLHGFPCGQRTTLGQMHVVLMG